jgi:hypothetical protein
MQDEVAITLTHSFLKVLARHLSATVQVVEQVLGPIRIEEKNNPKPENKESLIENLSKITFVE